LPEKKSVLTPVIHICHNKDQGNTLDMETASKSDTVYLIHPRLGGLANDTVIQIEKGEILYHVKAKLFSPLGRQYGVYDESTNELLLRTEQDNTALFPRHTVFQHNRPIGKLGQSGIIPQLYFMQLTGMARAEVHLGTASPVFKLESEDETVFADIAQYHSTWIVIIPKVKEHFLVLSCLAIIYRENTIAGC